MMLMTAVDVTGRYFSSVSMTGPVKLTQIILDHYRIEKKKVFRDVLGEVTSGSTHFRPTSNCGYHARSGVREDRSCVGIRAAIKLLYETRSHYE